jgi:ribosomal protein L14E/L6E/L27E
MTTGLTHLQDIEFLASVQHDCCTQGCTASGSRAARQERVSSGVDVHFVEHVDDAHFVINMHAMHNAHRVRRVLPRELIRPRHLYENRVSRHHEMSKAMHAAQTQKRAETQAKAQATRAKNAAKKAAEKEAEMRGTKRPRTDDTEGPALTEGAGDAMEIA